MKYLLLTANFERKKVVKVMLKDQSMRLNKYISQSGICSRREADRFIENGQVKINRKKATIEDRVNPGDEVMVNGQIIVAEEAEPFVLLACNKPEGIVSTTDSTERSNIVSYINYPTRIFPIGRLDKDSKGLILMTNDGDIVNKILRAGNNHEKEYIVSVDKPISDDFITKMGNGVPILGVMTKKCKVEKVGSHTFRIILVQGLNRQIRRMCEHFKYTVKTLERVRIMHIKLGDLPLGEFRAIEGDELTKLSKLIEHSSSEADPKTKSQRNSHNKKHTKKQTKKKTGNSNSHRSHKGSKKTDFRSRNKKRRR